MRWVQVQREFNEELDDRRKDRMRGKEGVVGAGVSPIWCMDFVDNLVVVGCADGRLEFWEGSTGKLKVSFVYLQILNENCFNVFLLVLCVPA